MSERAAPFMDKWLDENVDATHLKRPENIIARILAKRCRAAAHKAQIPLEEIAETVGDLEEAIVDELRALAAAAAVSDKRP